MYHVYAAYNPQSGKIYIGQTENLDERLRLHNEKTFRGSYTSRFDGNWILVYSEQVPTRKEAIQREKQLKSYQGRQFVKKHIPA